MSDEIRRLNEVLAGRYVVRRELGRGGMATVWLADDVRHERPVALKVLRPDLAESLGADRFLREIRITANLNHPHILPLLDSGEADGLLFYVMPYVQGESLRARLEREKQLPLDEAARITTQVADALHYAHEHDVVHRDVKPENILLEDGHAVVADFGVARAFHAAGVDTLTKEGTAVGTPVYMSPEQMSAEPHVDGRSDIYALGCVLYEMLAGEPPFTGPTVQVILARKSAGTVPDLRTVRASVPVSYERAIGRALASAPAERFSTAREFIEALSVPARRRSRLALAALAVTAIVLLAVLFLTGLLPGMVKPAAAGFFEARGRVLVADFENQTAQPSLDLAVRQAVMTDLAQSGYAAVVERSELGEVLQRMQLADSARLDAPVAVEIARRQGYPAVITGSIVPVGTGYQMSVQIVEASTGDVAVRLIETAQDDEHILEAVERLVHLTRRHLGESLFSVRRSRPLPEVTTPSLEALTLFARGLVHVETGDYGPAIRLAEQAVALDTAFAAAHRALGIWYENTGNPVSAQRHIDTAHRHGGRLLPGERFLVGAAYHAFRGWRDSTEYYYRLVIDRDPDNLTALNNLGDLYERLGRYDDALRLYRQAVAAGGTSVAWLNLASAARTIGMHGLADSVLTVMQERFPTAWHTWYTAARNAFYAEDEAAIEQIARDMIASEHPYPRLFGRLQLASLRARHGQLQSAVALADSAGRAAGEIAARWDEYLSLQAVEFAALVARVPEQIVPILRDRAEPGPLGVAPLFESIALGQLAMGFALAGDAAEAGRLLSRVDSLETALGLHALGLAAEVRAASALLADRPEESLEHLQQARADEFGLLRHSARFLLAETYAALDRHRDAAAHFDSLTSTYRLNFADVNFYGSILPLAHRRAADSFLAVGDTTAAIEHLAAFLELWQNPDADQVPAVTSARNLLSRLSGERAPGPL